LARLSTRRTTAKIRDGNSGPRPRVRFPMLLKTGKAEFRLGGTNPARVARTVSLRWTCVGRWTRLWSGHKWSCRVVGVVVSPWSIYASVTIETPAAWRQARQRVCLGARLTRAVGRGVSRCGKSNSFI
jgi:hypothetical protein